MATNPYDDPKTGVDLAAPNPYDDPNYGKPRSNIARGAEVALRQIPQTIGGVIGLAGDAVGAKGVRDYGMGMYEGQSKAIQAMSQPSDSFTNVVQGKDGANLGDFLKYGAGYVGGQAATALATGGIGGFVGRKLAERGIAAGVGELAAQQALKRGTTAGAATALGASNFVQEAGSIYPDAVQQAQSEGRTLDGGDLARVAGAGALAAGVETLADTKMLKGVFEGASGAPTYLKRAASAVPKAFAREAGTEAVQTGIERVGAQQDLTSADAVRDYVDSAALGGVGGVGGGAVGAVKQHQAPVQSPPVAIDPNAGPISRAAAMLALPNAQTLSADNAGTVLTGKDRADATFNADNPIVETGQQGAGRGSEIMPPANAPALPFDNAETGLLVAGPDGVLRPELKPEAVARTNAQAAAAQMQPDDIVGEQGRPFKTRFAAMAEARRAGPGFVAVPATGGYVVRQSGEINGPSTDIQPVSANPAGTGRADSGTSLAADVGTGNADAGALDAGRGGNRPPDNAVSPDSGAAAVVPGATAFPAETGTLGIPRSELPQVKTEHHGALTQFLAARGITHENDVVDPATLKPTQAEYMTDKVQAILADQNPGDGSILISSDGYILDGHHAALAQLSKGEPIKAIRLNAPISQLIEQVKEFPSATQATEAVTPEAKQPAQGAAPAAMPSANGKEVGNQPAANGAAGANGATVQPNAALIPEGGKNAIRSRQGTQPAGERPAPVQPGTDQAQPPAVRAGQAGPATGTGGAERSAQPVKPLSIGMLPNTADPVTVKDGIVHIGKDQALNFDSGEPIKVAAGATDAQIKKALQDGGAVARRMKFFGGKADSEVTASAPASAVAAQTAEPASLPSRPQQPGETSRPGHGIAQPGHGSAEFESGNTQSGNPSVDGTPAASVAATPRPANWRTNFLAAAKVARSTGIDPKGKKLAGLVAEIEAKDGDTKAPAAGNMTVSFDGKTYPVGSVEDAQSKWDQFRAAAMREGGGSRDVGNGVVVKDATGQELGRISYNGRYWPKEAKSQRKIDNGQPAEAATAPVVAENPTEKKEPWQMTRAEYVGQQPKAYQESVGNAHRIDVLRAIRDGKPVPAAVLADYPDLQGKKAETAQKSKINGTAPTAVSIAQTIAEAGPVATERAGVRIEENAQDDRLRLFFDGKPDEAVRTDLKANGFRWSPNAGAWQRQLTDNARSAARTVLDKHFPVEGGNVAMFSRSTAIKTNYDSRIDALFAGAKASDKGVTVLDRSDMLAMLGLGDGPVRLAEGKVLAGKENHPHMAADVWKRVPEWLENPAAVFASDTVGGRLVFVAPELVNGASVRMVVEPNMKDVRGGVTVHLLQNAYDAQGRQPFSRWVKDGLAKYIDQKIFPAILERLGLQLPNGGLQNKPGTIRILSEKNLAGYRKAKESAGVVGKDPGLSGNLRRGNGTQNRGLPTSEVRTALAPALAALKVPYALHDTVQAARSTTGFDIPNGVKGAYFKGKLHLIAENIAGPLIAEETFWHEVNHAGLDAMYGSGSKAYENALRGMALQNANIRTAAKVWMERYGKEDYESRIAAGVNPERAMLRTKLQAVDEALAELAGRNATIKGLPRFIAAVQKFMRSIGLNRLADSLEGKTDAQALSMIMAARDAVTNRRQTQSAGVVQPAFSAAVEGSPAPDTGSAPQFSHTLDDPTLGWNTSPDALRKMLGTPGYSQRNLAPIMRDVHTAGALRDQLDVINRKFETEGHISDQGLISLNKITPDYIKAAKAFAQEHGLTLAIRSNQVRGADRPLMAQDFTRYTAPTENTPFGQGREWRGANPVAYFWSPEGTGVTDATPMFSRGGHLGELNAAASWNSPEPSKFDDMVYKLQDKHIDTRRVMQAIQAAGKQLGDEANVYQQEELFHGRTAKRTEDFVSQELQPLVETMRHSGVTLDELDKFLHARHAQEANELIAERNKDLPDGGSGIKTSDAQAQLTALDPAKRKALEAAAAKVDAIIAGTRKLYVDYGLEAASTVNGWAQMFKNYVPLMREDHDGGMGIGQGFSIKGKESKGRTGSANRKVVDILGNVALQRERAIVRGEKNRVSTALVGLAEANPNPEFWTVGKAPKLHTYDPETNSVKSYADPLFKSRDHVVVAKVNIGGKIEEKAVIFNEDDPRAVRMSMALKNLDAGKLEGLLSVSAKITRYFAAINTQYNPLFAPVNLIRDYQDALLNLTSTPLAGKQKDISKHVLSALTGIYKDARAVRDGKKATSEWAQHWEDFQNYGGQTGYRDLYRTSADRAAEIERSLDPAKWTSSPLGKLFHADGAMKVPMAIAQRQGHALFGWLSDYNEAAENAVRLSAYRVAVDGGMSKPQAASLAKNLTVNFNRKGQIGQQAGAVYAFFNAAVQGSARMGKTLFDMDGGDVSTIRLSKAGKRIVYGGMLLGSMQAMLLAAAGFDDDEPPDFVRQNNLVIPTGGQGYITIPMPLGFKILPNLGRIPTQWALGGFKKPAQHVVNLLGIFADAFNPIGNAGLSMQTLAPTALDPLVAIAENRDWTGRPIAKVSFDRTKPGPALARDTATLPGKLISEGINRLFGGDEFVAGAVSPTPDQIDYLLGQVAGGVGREAGKVQQALSATLVTGEELPKYKMPLVGRFYGDSASQAAQASVFYANMNRMNEHEAEVKGLRKDGRGTEAAAYIADHPEARMIFLSNIVDRQIQKLRTQKRDLLAKDAPREQILAIEQRTTAAMTQFNDRIKALREQAP